MIPIKQNKYYNLFAHLKIDKNRYQNKVMKEISNMFLMEEKT